MPNQEQRIKQKYYAEAVRYMDNARAYDVLHLDGYYDGNFSIPVIQSGFGVACDIIEKTKSR